jgi:hypothetical protein
VDLDLDRDRDLNPDASYYYKGIDHIVSVLTKTPHVIYAGLIHQAIWLLVADLLMYIYICSGIQYKGLLD